MVHGDPVHLIGNMIVLWTFAIQVSYQALFSSMGQHITSMSLHLLGAALGVPLGIYLLRSGRVDCEGWDWFSVRGRVV